MARSARKFTTSTIRTVTSTVPITIGTSLMDAAETASLAHAGQREHLLDEHRPAQQADHGQAQRDHAGAGRVAQHVPPHHRSLGDAARPERPDVVLARGVQHGGPELGGGSGDRSDQQGDHRQRHRRQPAGHALVRRT